MLVFVIIGSFAVYVLIGGIWRYIKNPKPAKGLSYKEYYNYYDSLKYAVTDEIETDNTAERIKLEKEIDFYSAQIAMLEDLQRLIEKDLHNGSGNKKANLSRLITTDKQIHATQQKIDKLINELESLE